jgi:hypothetical protein
MANDIVGDLDLFGQAASPMREPFTSKNGISQNTLTGRYAEFMVCAYLTRMGFNVMHVDAPGYDLILDYEHRNYRIDVKASSVIRCGVRKARCIWTVGKSRKHINGQQRNGKTLPITRQDADLLALYHLEFDTVAFYPILKPLFGTLTIPLAVIKASGDGQASLGTAMERLLA